MQKTKWENELRSEIKWISQVSNQKNKKQHKYKASKKRLIYFFKNSSSTTAEMSRSGLPIPNRIPWYSISCGCWGRSWDEERVEEWREQKVESWLKVKLWSKRFRSEALSEFIDVFGVWCDVRLISPTPWFLEKVTVWKWGFSGLKKMIFRSSTHSS